MSTPMGHTMAIVLERYPSLLGLVRGETLDAVRPTAEQRTLNMVYREGRELADSTRASRWAAAETVRAAAESAPRPIRRRPRTYVTLAPGAVLTEI